MPRDGHSLAATIVPSERLHCADCTRVAVGEQVDDQADQPDQFTAEYEQPPYCAATSLAAGFAPEQLPSGTVVPRGSRLQVTERVRVAFAEQLRSEEHTSELQSLMLIPYAVFCLSITTTTHIKHTNTTK